MNPAEIAINLLDKIDNISVKLKNKS